MRGHPAQVPSDPKRSEGLVAGPAVAASLRLYSASITSVIGSDRAYRAGIADSAPQGMSKRFGPSRRSWLLSSSVGRGEARRRVTTGTFVYPAPSERGSEQFQCGWASRDPLDQARSATLRSQVGIRSRGRVHTGSTRVRSLPQRPPAFAVRPARKLLLPPSSRNKPKGASGRICWRQQLRATDSAMDQGPEASRKPAELLCGSQPDIDQPQRSARVRGHCPSVTVGQLLLRRKASKGRA